MIKGFEKETNELTDYELKLVNPIVKGLSTKVGKDSAVTNKTILEAMKKLNYNVTASRIRKIIHHIRVNKLVPNLISSNTGYWIATSQEEIFDYIDSLHQRMNSINEVIKSFD